MQRFILFLLFSLIFSTSIFSQERSEYILDNASEFRLLIEGFNEVKGEVRVAVFNSSEKFTKDPVYAVVIPVDGKSVEWSIPNLPFGEYAIAVYHDKNENGKLDTNFLGIPKESYGFSNNARGRFGPASWKDAKIEVLGKEFSHQIIVK